MDKSNTVLAHEGVFVVIPESVLSADITSNAIRVYLVIRRFADKDLKMWPGRATIAKKARISVATVDRAIKELKDIGAVKVEQRRDPDNPNRLLTNLYTITVPILSDGGTLTSDGRGTLTDDGRGTLTSDEVTRTIELEPLELDTDTSNVVAQQSKNETDSQFDEFWGSYPKKKDKKKAHNAFNRLSASNKQKALEGVVRYAKYCEERQTESRFILHPSTFLNGHRWEDELDAVSDTDIPASGTTMEADVVARIFAQIENTEQDPF